MLEWRTSSGTRTLRSLRRGETPGSWRLEKGDPAIWPLDLLLDQFIEDAGVGRRAVLRGALQLH